MKKIQIVLFVLFLVLITTPVFGETAAPKSVPVSVDGDVKSVYVYNIAGSNYFKLRDLAALLNGTQKQFDIYWNSQKSIAELTTNKSYAGTGDNSKLPS
jgi:hypothetical protein